MKLYSVKIGDVVSKLAVVSSEKDMEKGLSGSKKLKPGYGMLFDFKEPQDVIMNMGNMNYDIDMLFVCSSLKVKRAIKMTTKAMPIMVKDILYVIELNAGEGAKAVGKDVEIGEGLTEVLKHEKEEKEEKHTPAEIGGGGVNIIIKIETAPSGMKEKFKRGGSIDLIENDVAPIDGKMQVLDDKGVVLMNISGGERIFSIEHTAEILELAEKVKSGDIEPKELGSKMKKIIDTQDTQEPEYVKD